MQPRYLTAEQQLDLPDSEINYGVAALALTRDYVPGFDITEGLKTLDSIADRVHALLERQPDRNEPEVKIAAINTVLFREYDFRYDLTDFPKQTSEKRLLGNLLRRRRGTCANLPDLYYAVAERLGLPIYMVEAPQHAFLRYEFPDGRHINIEATGRGGEMSDDEYLAEMEIPKAALDLGTMMRPLSRREALMLLVQERTWHMDRHGDLEGLLAQSALLRTRRPKFASVFWNSAVWEVVAGRAEREGAKTDPNLVAIADQSFKRAREFTKRALELGITKPDNQGDYLARQIAIRDARLGERGGPVAQPERWDALGELERIIAEARPSELDWATVYRKPRPVRNPEDLDGVNEIIAINRHNQRVLADRLRDDGPSPNDGLSPQSLKDLAISDVATRYNQAIRKEDKLQALSQLSVLLGGSSFPEISTTRAAEQPSTLVPVP